MNTSRRINSDGELLTRANIEKYVSQYQIMAYYLGRDFYKDIGKAIHSPLHRDDSPSFVIYINKGQKIYWKDLSLNTGGTAYDYVMKLHHYTMFIDALKRINTDFDLGLYYKNDWVDNGSGIRGHISSIKELEVSSGRSITVIRRKWNLEDAEYWGAYGITESLLRQYHGWTIDKVFLDDRLISTYKRVNPIYGYQFYENEVYSWKIYWPKESKNRKWLSTANGNILQGEEQLPKTGDILVITKSMKDVIVLKTLDIAAVATQGETILVNKDKAQELSNRFTNIYILFDFDYTGVSGANKMKKRYGWKPIFLQNFSNRNNGRKDISDVRKLDGRFIAYDTMSKLLESK